MRGTAAARRLTRILVVVLGLALVGACASAPPSATLGTENSGKPSPDASTAIRAPAQSPDGPTATAAGVEPAAPDPRVEAAVGRLTSDTELVDQLLFVGWVGTTPKSVRPTLRLLHPGGIVFVAANANHAAAALEINDAIAADADDLGIVRPFRAIDHEGGSVQRIQDVPNLGSNLAFGAGDPKDRMACRRGADQAADLAAMHFDMNLAPVMDVLTNPDNTVIGDRSYGSDPGLVARLGAAYIRGLQGAGVMGVGKHFPGHGATSIDSHLGLPVLRFGPQRLERVELLPFERALEPDVEVSAIMVGHIALPKIDPSRTPSSLSKPIVTGLLRERLGFDGLVMTDDVGSMEAVTAHYNAGQAAVMAITAGVDMVLIVGDQAKEIVSRDALLEALATGALSRDRLMDAVRHVLEAKARFGLLGGDPPPAGIC
jgi:beta-N-acetylhexosaminidase